MKKKRPRKSRIDEEFMDGQCDHMDKPETRPEISIETVSNQVRDSIRKWVHKQSNQNLRQLEEGKHYALLVSRDRGLISASIRCLVCNTAILLHRKYPSDMSLPFLLSNWTKHSKNCYMKYQSLVPKIHQSTLKHFMTNPVSAARAQTRVSAGKNETQSENATNSIEGSNKSETVNLTEMVDLTNEVSPISSTCPQNELSLQSNNVTNVEQVFQ